MSETKTIYIGNGVRKGDTWLTSSLCLSDIPAEHMFEFNGKKYIKVNINLKDEVDQYGKDVSITVDTWKPESEKSAAPKSTKKMLKEVKATAPPSLPEDDDLPF